MKLCSTNGEPVRIVIKLNNIADKSRPESNNGIGVLEPYSLIWVACEATQVHRPPRRT
jgi:hypothetical protein